MPKIIEDLRETILLHSRRMLLGDGYDRLTVRGVAAACGVAVGTVYNYFPSKEMLAASVMLCDWTRAQHTMHERALCAESVTEGLSAVFGAIRDFCAVYAEAWAQFGAHSGAMPAIRMRHGLLIEQLIAVIEPLTVRFGCRFHPVLPRFLAETLLSAAAGGATFDDLAPVLGRLLCAADGEASK